MKARWLRGKGKEASELKQDQYVYAVTRIHNHEQGLLSRQDIEQLLAAESEQECLRLLSEKGWGSPAVATEDPDAMLAYETDKTWNLVEELIEDLEPFNVLRCGIDFHNLKAAIKLVYSGEYDEESSARYFRSHGTVALETIVDAARRHDFSELPPALAKAGSHAYEVLAHTASGQACDMSIDCAALVEMQSLAENTGSELLMFYARLTADTANIKSAIRACRMGRDASFLERAIAPAGSLDRARLIQAALQGEQAIYDYMSETDYAEAIASVKTSLAMFERWCGNLLIEHIKPQRYQYAGVEPVAAFLLGRENEIAMVRLVLSAIINKLDDAAARERLRDMYV